jgi:trk system potassium uptake protein TrkA
MAGKLCDLNHDVVVVDKSAEALEEVEAQVDILTVQGWGSNPHVLKRAGVDKSDLLVAVTNSDETNLLACILARQAGVPHKVARIGDMDYVRAVEPFALDAIGADMLVCPREENAREIFNTLRTPGTLEVVDLLEGRLMAVNIDVPEHSPLTEAPLGQFGNSELLQAMRFIAYRRNDKFYIPRGETSFEPGDKVYLVVRADTIQAFMDWCWPGRTGIGSVVIAGGGYLGMRLAQLLEAANRRVALIEPDPEQADYCSNMLDRTLVLNSDSLQEEVLKDAGMREGTAFVAVTADDEDNIIGCLLAKKLGAAFAVAQVNKPEYVPIIHNLDIVDKATNPHLAMINAIVKYVRGTNVHAARQLQDLPGELLEINITGQNRWAGRMVKNIQFHRGAVIAAVLRGSDVLIPTGTLRIEEDDRLVIYSMPEAVRKLSSLCNDTGIRTWGRIRNRK